MAETVFSKIAQRQLPAQILYEDDEFMSILSINPHTDGHTLIFPKEPLADTYLTLESDTLCRLMQLAQKIGRVLKDEFNPDRVTVLFEGLGVRDHVHVNLIPINSPFDLDQAKAQHATDEQLQPIGDRLRAAIKRLGDS